MLELIKELWKSGAAYEVEKMRRAFISVIAATIIGLVLIFSIRPGYGLFAWLVLIPWVYSAVRLFKIYRLLKLHVAGEVLEALEAAFAKMKISADTPETSIFANPFISMYWNVVRSVFLIQTSLFLMAPLYVHFTVGGISAVIIILMVASVVAFDRPRFFWKASRRIVSVTVILYVIGLIFYLFPSLRFYTGAGHLAQRIISPSSVAELDSVNELRKKQREAIYRGIAQDAYRWQQQHPGQDLPPQFEELIRRAGGNPSLTDFFKRGRTSNI